AAARSIAEKKWDQVKDLREKRLPEAPEYGLRDGGMSHAMSETEEYLRRVADIEAENQRIRAEQGIAYDGFAYARLKAKEAAAAALKVASGFETTLKGPLSDEMRVALTRIEKLHLLHGSAY